MIELHRLDGGVAMLSLARREARNAVSIAMWHELGEAIEQIELDTAVRAVVLASAVPGMFCPGADIKEFAALKTSEALRTEMQQAMQWAVNAIEACTRPVIAAIDGPCVGAGCSIALACDLRLATPDARFGITPARLGLVYGLADTRRLVAAVGRSAAKRLLFAAGLIDAPAALSLGLIDETHDGEALMDEALALARHIAGLSPLTHRATKEVLRRIDAGQLYDDPPLQAAFRAAFAGEDVLKMA